MLETPHSIPAWNRRASDSQHEANRRRALERRIPFWTACLVLWIGALAAGHGTCLLLKAGYHPLFALDLLAVVLAAYILNKYPIERRDR